ncbi:hypothetical protein J132_00128 [Termitomyces sp. J132]|nr:hypothetical protein J132_00128 [Termitomyces sp. J132]
MDASFQFPRHMAPIPRPAPLVATPTSSTNRESNALRASVLDVALELGIGHNSTVLNWMFNNSLTEEDEERLLRNLCQVENQIQLDKYIDKKPDSQVAGGGVVFSDPPAPSRPTTPSRGKLRKKRADGYESDGGYMSDGGKKKKEKEREKEAKERAKEEKQQEKREKEEERKRRKSMKVKKGEDKDGYATGYDTDGASKKSKAKSADGGYETDSGYLSSTSTRGKSKGRFFGLKSKQLKVDRQEVPPMPTVEKESVVLPIASKFATTIDTGPLLIGESLDSMISKAMDGPMASATTPPSQIPLPPSGVSVPSSFSRPIIRPQLPQVTSESVSTLEPTIPLSPITVFTTPVQSLPATTQFSRLPAPVAVQPRSSPINVTQSSCLPPTIPTYPSRPSPTATTQALRPRPRNPPTEGFGPRPTLTPSTTPPSPSNPLSPNPAGSRQSLSIIPSTDYIVPSPHPSPLPLSSPSVLAYYDIPPPSPPPSGPLPKIPLPGSLSSRSRTLERSVNGTASRSRTPEPRLLHQPIPNIQRGRENPFPLRPILPQPTAPGVGPGLEADSKVSRYKELPGLSLPKEKNDQVVERREVDKARDWVKERDSMAKRSSVGSWDAIAAYGGEDDEDDDDDMRDVLERFEEARINSEIDAIQNELDGWKALGRSQSFEAIKERIKGRYEDNQDPEDEALRKSLEDDGDTNSRWSGTMSIYSRTSVLDPEKSEEARQRFIKRVEDLYGDGGREKIPPVPKIPDAFIDGSGQSWSRF